MELKIEVREDREPYCLCCHDKLGIPIRVVMTVFAMITGWS